MNKYKKINLTILGLSVLVLIITLSYWKSVCEIGGCSYDLRNNLLRPLVQSSIVLSLIFGVFLLLPARYFESWFKRIFSWAFPLSFIIVLGTENSGSILSFSKALTVQILGVLFGIISAFFVLFTFLKERRAKTGV